MTSQTYSFVMNYKGGGVAGIKESKSTERTAVKVVFLFVCCLFFTSYKYILPIPFFFFL